MVIIKAIRESLIPNNFTGVLHSKACKDFLKNNLLHRYYGPAFISFKGYKSWYFNDKNYGNSYYKYNQKHFIKDINKQWLL